LRLIDATPPDAAFGGHHRSAYLRQTPHRRRDKNCYYSATTHVALLDKTPNAQSENATALVI
jgi:hypothetical protein